LSLNQAEGDRFKTSIEVEIISPFALGSLKMGVKNIPSVTYIDVASLSSLNLQYGKDLSEENGYAYVIVSNAIGRYQIDIYTKEAESITSEDVDILRLI
jgi:hypothetical protein